jgi:DNA-binding transcriptional regulator YiaG
MMEGEALSQGEIHWLRRRRAGVGQTRWARDRGISVDRLRMEEHDLAMSPAVRHLATLTDGEWCALQRKRRGWSTDEAAAQIGISRMTLYKAENGRTAGVTRVKAFYLAQGVLPPSDTRVSGEPVRVKP